ncbi:MAG: DUF2334 domain-containing protein [Muribaculaceae bacterium]|nr:DUF2334 domain-containing protein [Muribaculaceae bacterium]
MMGRKIAVRMDDITPDMNWENFYFFQKLFEEAGITPLLGIVPDNRDEKLSCGESHKEFYAEMKKLEQAGYCFAMHGCHHVYTTKKGGLFPLNCQSEFAGVPLEEQKNMLQAGKERLRAQGIDTDIFMAPAHSYDNNTLRALKETGFCKVTDGFGKVPYTDRGLTFYPISFLLRRSLTQKDGVTTMVIHANTVTEADKERYQRIFKEYREQLISYVELFKIQPVKRRLGGRVLEYLLAKGKYLLVRMRSGMGE